MTNINDIKIAIIGLGYVGLPLAVEFGKKVTVIGFDINSNRIAELVSGTDHTLEVSKEELAQATHLSFSYTYGDHPALPKVEGNIGNPLSPYAVTKYVNELYADVFARTYGFNTIGLRYFNIFGKRQTPDGAYAAVIPKWTAAMITGDDVFINGDGDTSRDFNFIENAVQANILAATATAEAKNEVYNVAVGGRTTLNTLFTALRDNLAINGVSYSQDAVYRNFRAGDVRHSQADISKIKNALGYTPEFDIIQGIEKAMPWYVTFLQNSL